MQSDPQPFKILYNFRTKGKQPQKPRRKSSACQKHLHIPQFTMRTRKMTAEIELKHELDQLEIEDNVNNEEQIAEASQEPLVKSSQDEDFFLKNQDELENGIPISPEAQKEILFNFAQNSQISSYSKLEKALSGFGLDGDKMDEQ